MKYFKVFNTEAEYLEYAASYDFLTPNVSTLRDCTNTWITAQQHRYDKDYFTVESLEDNNTIKMVRNINGGSINDYTVAYSTDDGTSWQEITILANSAHTYDIATLNSGEKVMFKFVSGQFDRDNGSFTYFDSDGRFNVYGNITSLRATDFSGYTGESDLYIYLFRESKVVSAKDLVLPFQTVSRSGFTGMFSDCTYLTDAPELPATTFSGGGCYRSMFSGCTSLTTAPELPATTLTDDCYRDMFSDCTSLTAVPSVLPATTMADNCYRSMFCRCTSLTVAPEISATTMAEADGCCQCMFLGCSGLTTAPSTLLATTLDNNCYYGMFGDCKSLVTPPTIQATTLDNGCCWRMFSGCTSLATAPELHSSTMKVNCYTSMFKNCTSLTVAPTLSATSLDTYCYSDMFYGCSGLTTPPSSLPALSIPKEAYKNMFNNCSSLQNMPQIAATTVGNNGCENMFSGCTSLTLATELHFSSIDTNGCIQMFKDCTSLVTPPSVISASTIGNKGCENMFMGCTSLTTAPEISATTLANECYRGMFDGCTSLTAAPELPATTLSDSCYRAMFANCSNLESSPELPATTLADGCYRAMFANCSLLTSVPSELPVTTLADSCYQEMFLNCSNLTTTPELPATTLANNCYAGMFRGCSRLTTAPSILSATTLADSCYREMFRWCAALTTAPEICATTVANECCIWMFAGCTSLTTAPSVLPATTLADSCYYTMFGDCTALTTAPELPAQTLVYRCYWHMFDNSNVSYIKCLATDISATECTEQWLYRAPNNTGCTFVKNSVMSDWTRTSSGIPSNWNVRDDTYITVTGVTLNTGSTTVNKGNTYTLTATVLPSNADDKAVTWSTSDPSVATVVDGVVTGVGCGNATITVTTHEGSYTAQCSVSVENHVTSADLNTYIVTIVSGNTYQLEATVLPADACNTAVTWSSSDSAIATVDATGLVSGVTTGSATVTVTSVDNSSATKNCAVTVAEPQHATGVTLSESAITITENSRHTLTATVLPSDAVDKSVTWTSSNSGVATVDSNGVVSGVASGDATITVTTVDGGHTDSCSVTVEEATFTAMTIGGASAVSAETCQYRAICDNVEDVTSSATWSITAGSQYATINQNNGQVTVLNGANESSVTIQAEYAGLTATTTVTLTYLSGATSETTSVITTDVGGNSTSVVTTVTEYEDGSSTEVVETVITDANGDLVGSTESTTTTNADGSYNGATTNYDENGDPVNGSNVTGDTEGNVSTQTVEYDDSGNATVTGYDIDTTESESGKTFNSGGTNTEYYAFDLTHGFTLDFDFTIDFANQPPGQSDGHHNILTAKRADPSPWYGFQLRHSSTNKYIDLGTQFASGSNTNKSINPLTTTGNVGTYNLRIIYDPTSTGDTFTCIDTYNQSTLYSSNLLFPDIEELKYLKITIGNATDSGGAPFRYSNITVTKFELKKLKHVANPTITCENNEVSISCSTVEASVYYRLNLYGDYSAYTTSFTITADTVVQAYATYSGDTSDIIREDCKYGLEKPVISCDGEEVTITCVNTGVTIYYRLNESGSYSAYTAPIAIVVDTVVEAYSELGVERSEVVKETCLANVSVTGVTLNENSITINRFETYTLSATVLPNNATNKNVTWSSSNANVATVDSNGVVSSVASGSAIITVTTVDGSYTAQCSVSVTNRYAYFTLVSLADNNMFTLKNGSTAARNLSYSLDDGATWSSFSLTVGATKTIATINSGDTIIMKGDNAQLANDYNKGCYFRGTQNYEVEGNISSLIRNNDTDTEITGGTFHFAQLFSGDTHLISAENLKVVSTTLYKSSFNGTFRSCTNLQKAPDLSIPTTLAQETYSSMFEGCTSMSQPPTVLSATTAQLSTYKRMFCMNRNSQVTTQMTKSPIMIGNFGSETSVDKDFQVFKGNGSLTEVKCFWTNTSNSFGSLSEWMKNVASTGTFYKRSTQTFSLNSANGIPTGWTVVNDDVTGG